MRTTSFMPNFNFGSPMILAGVGLMFSSLAYAISSDEASQQVKTLMCRDQQTVEQVLEQSIRSHSQRDIGWRTFQEDGYYDVERAVLINKGMELHYRWRVNFNGQISSENERTEKLCAVPT